MRDSSPGALAWIEEALAALGRRGLERRLRVREGALSPQTTVDGRPLLHFGSNDYLALASDPRVVAAAVAAVGELGWGAGASPLLLGHTHQHQQLQDCLAAFEQTEAALVFGSGFAANTGTIAALVGPGDVVFSDQLNHASLWDGCRLSRADVRAYAHGDCQDLARLLDRARHARRRLIVTESLFSMDGDLAPLAELVDLAERYDAIMLVDEAHATGVFGASGRGVAEHLGVAERIAVRIGTLSKALGGVGGFVAGSRALVAWLVNRARPYGFSTAVPAAAAAAALAALQIVRQEPWRRTALLQRAALLRARLAEQGWDIGPSCSQIIPLMVGDSGRAMGLSQALAERGLFVPAIRPPSVPEGKARLRISLTYAHTEAMIETLLAALGALRSSWQRG